MKTLEIWDKGMRDIPPVLNQVDVESPVISMSIIGTLFQSTS